MNPMNAPLEHRRKIAVATWLAPRESRIQTKIQVELSAILEYLEQTKNQALTITHIVGGALARAIAANPEVNVRVIFGKVKPLPRVDVSFAVDMDNGSDLAQWRIKDADKKTLFEISQELVAGAEKLRARRDENYQKSVSWAKSIPTPFMRPVMKFLSMWTGGLGLRAFGQPGHPLGSAFISNVGRFEMHEAYLAPLPFARTPIYMAIGKIHKAPVVIDDQVEAKQVVIITVVADHRLIDGAHAGKLIRSFSKFLDAPELLAIPAR
jgi:pyruvate/2-oxoglutarate dehydrogenase complex dihydrolipoamide acyltransferase (E2) component